MSYIYCVTIIDNDYLIKPRYIFRYLCMDVHMDGYRLDYYEK